MLVQPWVAAQMTDLLQGVVEHGSGRAAALGRPTAGKTGTTSSNKDGWFIGFSSGITTGVWMGRDDNRALPGLAGGRAPARAFHDFMARAVAGRPAEAFVTDAAAPDWQIEQNEEFWFAPPEDQPLVDADGNPIEPPPPFEEEFRIEETPPPRDPKQDQQREREPEQEQDPDRLDREWLERAIERPRPPDRERAPDRRPRREREAPKEEPRVDGEY